MPTLSARRVKLAMHAYASTDQLRDEAVTAPQRISDLLHGHIRLTTEVAKAIEEAL